VGSICVVNSSAILIPLCLILLLVVYLFTAIEAVIAFIKAKK
jgi:hypothetical protein